MLNWAPIVVVVLQVVASTIEAANKHNTTSGKT